MSLILVGLILVLLFGGGFGYYRYGGRPYGDGIGIVGVILIVLLLMYLFHTGFQW